MVARRHSASARTGGIVDTGNARTFAYHAKTDRNSNAHQNSTQSGTTLTVTLSVKSCPSSPVQARVKVVWESTDAVSTPSAPEEAAPSLTVVPSEPVTEQGDALALSRLQKRCVVSPSRTST